MRFFAHDGKTTHGPAGIDELLKIPGFDGDTLVCPVGSDDSSDWKPALAYLPFKKALLEAAPPAPVEPPKALPPMPALQPAPAPGSLPVPAPFPGLAPLDAPRMPPMAMPPPAAPPPPAPAPAPIPVEPPKAQRLCPRCIHANLEDARFCNACGARMDGRLEDISAPPPPPAPLSPAPGPAHVAAPAPAPEPSPAPPANGFENLDPMLTYPVEPLPPPPVSEPRPLQPGRMGRLGGLEDAEPAAPEPPSPAPEPVAEAAPVPVWKRPAAVFALAALAVVAVGGSYLMLGKSAPPRVAELTPAAETAAPAPEPAPAAEPAPPPVIYSAPPQTSSPAMPAPHAPKKKAPKRAALAAQGGPAETAAEPAPKPKRARKPRRAAAPPPEPRIVEDSAAGDTIIESRAPEPAPEPKRKAKGKRAAKAEKAAQKDPLLEALLTDATRPGTEAAAEPAAEAADKGAPMIGQRPAAKPGQFSLPGLERKVSASDRARTPQPDAEPPAAPSEDAAAAPAPAKSSPPPGIEDQPAKSAEGDQLALVQVHEQFDFCAQLLAQGAYGDHYDTCLCKDAREAAPYRGRRGFYVSAKKKEANAGRLETSAKITSSKIDLGVALVTARWKSGADEKGREAVQTWKLEDGLWCQAP